jgi:hypothetical protein
VLLGDGLMEITEKQKEIIKRIGQEKITDLYSYMEEFHGHELFKYDEEKIEAKKKEDFEQSKDKFDEYLHNVKKINFNFNGGTSPTYVNYSAEEIAALKDQLSNYKVNESDFEMELEIKGHTFKINPLREKVFVVKDLYIKVLEFLSLWNILEQKQMILTIPKKISRADSKLFIKKKKSTASTNTVWGSNQKGMHSRLSNIPNLPNTFNERKFYKNKDYEYENVELSSDPETIMVADNFVDKKILILPSLLTFIQDDFKTSDEKKYLSERRRANIAIAVSIIIAFISFGLSYYLALDNTNFWKENERNREEQSNKMNSNLEDLTEVFLDTNQELKEINKSIQNEKNDLEEELKEIHAEIDLIKEELRRIGGR